MNKTKIEWCDSAWNPVTGCLHGCEYCYARRIAERFGTLFKGDSLPEDEGLTFLPDTPERFYELDEPVRDSAGKVEPFPANFYPTFHRYRLSEPQRKKKPQNIFVCSMADLFGDWVPIRWIRDVIDACLQSPQHRYLFLTKNPARYLELNEVALLPHQDNFWYGSTVPDETAQAMYCGAVNTFWSMEPLLGPARMARREGLPKWIILGAMTGPGSAKQQPKREWVEDIVLSADSVGIPVFMKDSLIPIVGEENMRREFPWNTTPFSGRRMRTSH